MRLLLPRSLAIAALVLTPTLSARADEVSDAIQAAADAYAAGDLGKTAASLTLATQGLGALQGQLLADLLPAPPEGWTRSLTEDFNQSFGMLGGGSGAEARYENADQSLSFTITYIADNPMVAGLGAMLGNAQMMAMMGKVEMVGDQPVLDADGTLQALVNARVLFQAQGADAEVMLPVVQTIDFARLGSFDRK